MSSNVNDDNLVIVLTTMPDDERAEALAATLVEDRLAACVNILGVMRSVYRWKGSIEHDAERQVVIKTVRRRLAEVEARVRALHPYEVPEWIVVPADGVSAAYLQWARDAARGDGAAGTR